MFCLYGFANYSCKSFGNKNDVVSSTTVDKGIENNVNLILEKDAKILLKKGAESNIEQNVILNDNITAPIQKGTPLGKVVYTLNGEQLLEVNLLSESEIHKNTLWNLTTTLYLKWFNMLR